LNIQFDDGVDFSGLDRQFTELIRTSAPWLVGDHALRAKLGLHELLVNIRRHAYDGKSGVINVGMTASRHGVTVMITDWGRELPDLQRRILPTISEDGGYGLGIIDRVFSEVDYRRTNDHNVWVVAIEAADVTAH
jgi:anti-sigma regulatory factor (Ser/Thr protein kinase)